MKYLTALTLVFVASTSAYAQSKPPSKEAACRACHGPKGEAPIAPNYPKLNGQNKMYLAGALKAYRDGQRTGGLTAVMSAQAAQLSDADIEALATYYAQNQ